MAEASAISVSRPARPARSGPPPSTYPGSHPAKPDFFPAKNACRQFSIPTVNWFTYAGKNPRHAAHENIPAEANPYQDRSEQHALWAAGHEQVAGAVEASESEGT